MLVFRVLEVGGSRGWRGFFLVFGDLVVLNVIVGKCVRYLRKSFLYFYKIIIIDVCYWF